MFNFRENSALIVVDYQNDFIIGSLKVPEALNIRQKIVDYIDLANLQYVPVFATKDYHPPNHCSFTTHGGPFPPHCVKDTTGSFVDSVIDDAICKIGRNRSFPNAPIYKGREAPIEQFSGFAPQLHGESELAEKLDEKCVEHVYICGLATDFCVKETALDAQDFGYTTYVLADAIKGVFSDASDKAIVEMFNAGIQFVRW